MAGRPMFDGWTPRKKREWWEALSNDPEILPPVDDKDVQLVSLADTLESAKALMAQGDGLVGLSTGYPSLDAMTKGLAPGDLIIVFGDTSHGKSQLCQNIAYNVAMDSKPVLFVGLEMTNDQNTTRFLQIADDEVQTTFLSIFYPATNSVTINDLSHVVGAGCGKGAKLVVIDQLQQLSRNVDNLANELSAITHEIKRVAVHYKVPIMLVSHINRNSTVDKPPTLRDLKGSSSIEQDADICLAVWRDMENLSPELEVVLRKNRNRGMQHTRTSLSISGVKLSERLAF